MADQNETRPTDAEKVERRREYLAERAAEDAAENRRQYVRLRKFHRDTLGRSR